MTGPQTADAGCQPTSGRQAPRRRRRKVKWVLYPLAVLAGIASLLLCWPVASISPETAARITPGMTLEQVVAIVGAPPDWWYDGVVALGTNEPAAKEHWHYWTGSRGDLILEPDAKGRVSKVNFYPALWVERSLWELLIERLTRRTEDQWRHWWERLWLYGDPA